MKETGTSIILCCSGSSARASVRGVLTAGAVGIPVELQLDEAWQGLTRRLIVRGDRDLAAVVDGSGRAVLPWECLTAGTRLRLGLDGWDAEGTLRIPTRWADCGVVQPSVADAQETESSAPTLSEIQQLLYEAHMARTAAESAEEYVQLVDELREEIEQLKQEGGLNGGDGHSPYIGENGCWLVWDAEAGQYQDSGIRAAGQGSPGGWYTPQVDAAGNLTWQPSQPDLPPVPGSCIKGEPGRDGQDGRDGHTPELGVDYLTQEQVEQILTACTPAFGIGEVATLEPGSAATAAITGTKTNPRLNLGIPRGADGQGGGGGFVDTEYTVTSEAGTQFLGFTWEDLGITPENIGDVIAIFVFCKPFLYTGSTGWKYGKLSFRPMSSGYYGLAQSQNAANDTSANAAMNDIILFSGGTVLGVIASSQGGSATQYVIPALVESLFQGQAGIYDWIGNGNGEPMAAGNVMRVIVRRKA